MRCFLLAAAVPGCDYPRSRVHGSVKYQGKPVTGGTVIFLTRDNMTYVADIQPDGTYAIPGVPRGPVRVSVQQPPPRPDPRPKQPPGADANPGPKPDAPPPEAAPGFARLPAKYADPGQSGLSFELKDADQDYSLDLK